MTRNFLIAGSLLFLIGLGSGLAIPAVTNPRMGLSAHLEATINGMFLMIIGLAWTRLSLSARLEHLLAACLLVGTWGNWATVQFAAIAGTRSLTPIAAQGHQAGRGAELVAATGLTLSAIAILIAAILLVIGFWRAPEHEQD